MLPDDTALKLPSVNAMETSAVSLTWTKAEVEALILGLSAGIHALVPEDARRVREVLKRLGEAQGGSSP